MSQAWGKQRSVPILGAPDMPISQVNSSTNMAVAALRRNAALSNTASTSAAPRQADSVTLSDSARALAGANKTVASASDVREDRVAALKAAIADGTYSVDSRTLAQSMVKAGLK
jgi:negative regulator of flagellin synthesis FlgM